MRRLLRLLRATGRSAVRFPLVGPQIEKAAEGGESSAAETYLPLTPSRRPERNGKLQRVGPGNQRLIRQDLLPWSAPRRLSRWAEAITDPADARR